MKCSLFLNMIAAPSGWEQHQGYMELLAVAAEAEVLGYRSLWLTEHHAATAGASPDPFGLLSGVVACTSTLRVGTAARLVGLTTPQLLAEGAAQLDALSGGRFALGLARGFASHEFTAAGRQLPTPAEFAELVDQVRAALHSPDLRPRPVQPAVPVLVAASSEESLMWAADAGLGVLVNPYFKASRKTVEREIAAYRKRAGDEAYVFAHLLAHVAPGCAAPVAGLQAVEAYLHKHAPSAGLTAPALRASGLVAVGAPSTAASALRWLDSAGVDEVGLNPMLGLHPLADVRRTLALIADMTGRTTSLPEGRS